MCAVRAGATRDMFAVAGNPLSKWGHAGQGRVETMFRAEAPAQMYERAVCVLM